MGVQFGVKLYIIVVSFFDSFIIGTINNLSLLFWGFRVISYIKVYLLSTFPLGFVFLILIQNGFHIVYALIFYQLQVLQHFFRLPCICYISWTEVFTVNARKFNCLFFSGYCFFFPKKIFPNKSHWNILLQILVFTFMYLINLHCVCACEHFSGRKQLVLIFYLINQWTNHPFSWRVHPFFLTCSASAITNQIFIDAWVWLLIINPFILWGFNRSSKIITMYHLKYHIIL